MKLKQQIQLLLPLTYPLSLRRHKKSRMLRYVSVKSIMKHWELALSTAKFYLNIGLLYQFCFTSNGLTKQMTS